MQTRKYEVYPGRFYVLIAFALLALQQNLAWMTFGTIPDESYKHFGLSDNEITLLAAYGPILFILLMFPFIWFLDRFGLRVSMLSAVWILAVATGIQCLVPEGSTKWKFLFHVGHILIGAVGPHVMIMPPRLSSVWFPPNQRTFATAVTTMAQSVGIALGFITVPYLTLTYSIHTMLYVQAEMGLFVALFATIYFPPRPPSPPSHTADADRTEFVSSLKALACNPSFLVLGISGGLVSGANWGFSSVLSIILNPTSGFSDVVSVSSVGEFFGSNAWLGACSSLSAVIGGQLVALLADKLQRRFKLLLLALLTLATIFAFWFAVSVYGFTSSSTVNLFITLCLQYFFAFATTPLFYEAAVEVTYPVPEGSSAGVLTLFSNVATILLQIIALCHIFSNDHPERARAMVWVLGGLTALAGVTVVFFKENYQRLDKDSLKRESLVINKNMK